MGSAGPTNPLFEPVQVGAFELAHRLVYAPLTRNRAIDNVPQPAAVKYYSQRATKGGLMVTEGTIVSAEGRGYEHVPGIWSQEQIEAWKPVVQAVHAKGATFLLQLWHCGRHSHKDLLGEGQEVLSSSAVAEPDQQIATPKGSQPAPVPRALELSEIPDRIEQFVQGTRNALEAGFDGVEIHSANGYLLDQFLKNSVNKRTDQYGGCIENRSRFVLEIVDAVAAEVGADRVGIRFSPFFVSGAEDSHKFALFTYLMEELNSRDLAYVHMVEPRIPGGEKDGTPDAMYDYTQRGNNIDVFRKAYKGTFIVAGGHTRESGIRSLETDHADLVTYGRSFLANPDFVKRIEADAPLNKPDRSTFYSQEQVRGYTDYPFADGHVE